jgi:SulP family sulfate permease
MKHASSAPSLRRWRRLLPFLGWAQGYDVRALRRDTVAGVTVAVVLIPQSMAYALLAGLPAHHGLWAALVTPAVGALWGSLRQLATGPHAIVSLLVLTTLSAHAEPGSPAYAALAFQLAAMVGAVYLMLGLFRLGSAMSFVSSSTVKGFNAAAALIIIATQLPHLLGLPASGSSSAIVGLWDAARHLRATSLPTLGVGLLAFVMIYGIKRRFPRFPAALVAVSSLAALAWGFGLAERGVAIIGEVPRGLPVPMLPALRLDLVPQLLGPAFVIALVGFTGTYSIGRAISEQTHQRVDSNQELIGQGLANLAGSLFQSFPVSGSFSRTALGHSVGACSGVASLVASGVVLLALLFLAPALGYIPRAALAAVVIAAVLLLFHPVEVFSLWNKNRHDGIVAVTVFVLALLLEPDHALLIGVIVSLGLFLWKSMHPRIVVVTRRPGEQVWVNHALESLPLCPQLCMVRIDTAIYFANAEYTVEHVLEALAEHGPEARFLVLDMKGVGFIDITGAEELGRLQHELAARHVGLAMVGLHQPVQRVIDAAGVIERIGPHRLYTSYLEAVGALLPLLDHDLCRERCAHRVFDACVDMGEARSGSTL